MGLEGEGGKVVRVVCLVWFCWFEMGRGISFLSLGMPFLEVNLRFCGFERARRASTYALKGPFAGELVRCVRRGL